MDLSQPWVVVPALVAVVVVAVTGWVVLRRRRPSAQVPLANTEVLRGLPQYRSAVRAHRAVTTAVAVLVAGLAVAAVVGAARPQERMTLVGERDNRDIVLCLDVSGSMIDVDTQVVSTFRDLAAGFKGERIALVIFNSSAVPVFPLTDDYEFVDEQLGDASQALTRLDPRDPFFAGTLNGPGSSLIGDGLATCLRSFDHPDLPRARSVVLATDNEALGRSLFTLPEAGQLAASGSIQVYGVNPSDNPSSTAAVEMKKVVEDTGGLYFTLEDAASVTQILKAVGAREASRIPSRPRVVVHDEPTTPIVLAAAALFGLLVLRRVRWPS